MRHTWRWFGEHDVVQLEEIEQAGAQGIVTALHHIENGAVWSVEEIQRRKQQISRRANGEPTRLTWDVVESLPVSEDIKKQDADWREHIENYKLSLENLASCGLEVICYNFMPILDWTRTKLRQRQPHGGTAMAFDLIDFAVFDLFVLERAGAAEDYGDAVRETAHARFTGMSEAQRAELRDTLVAGLPGANDGWSLDDVREKLATYQGNRQQPLDEQIIKVLVNVSNQNSLQLSEAILNKNLGYALDLAKNLLNSNEPALRIVATLVGQFRTWTIVKTAIESGEKDDQKIAKIADIRNPKRIYFIKKQIRQQTAKQLQKSLPILLELEAGLKLGADPLTILETKIIELVSL